MSPALRHSAEAAARTKWDPNYRIKKQNELGPDMPDMPDTRWWWAPIGERDVHLQSGSAEVIELNMHKMTALIMRRERV